MKAYNGDVALAWEESGSGPPLLLIQGLGYARWGWEPVVPLLAPRWRTISFDNRGVGESSSPPGPYTAAEMADDAVAVLDAAGVGRAAIVGVSLGGMVAQELAVSHPERLTALVLIGTTPGTTLGHPMPESTVRLLAEASSWEPEMALRSFIANALGSEPDPATVERILAHRLASPQDPAGWAAQATAAAAYDGGRRAGSIEVPTLVISGTADRVVDFRNSQVLGELIPDSRVELVEDAGHLVFWEHPEAVAQLINEFPT